MNHRVIPFVHRLLRLSSYRPLPAIAFRPFRTGFPQRTLESTFIASLISQVSSPISLATDARYLRVT
jgi:hypothetical protein